MSQFAAHFLLMSSPRKAQNSLAYLDKLSNQPTMTNSLPTREDSIKTLRKNEEFDVLIIGGGSTGAGAALDAASRGFKTICVEREDFSSGTSSRSTKLIWGGSRYLVQALMSLFSFSLIKDPHKTIKKFNGDMKMVMNCHKERKFLLQNQHHLVYWLPIAVPLKQWILWPPPFGYYPAALGPLGLFPVFFKFYDSLGGFTSPPSHIMFPARAKRKFPQLNNAEIKYCSIFYEGMHDDARTNLAIALTAATKGACMANYCEVTDLLYELPNKKGKVVGAVICDTLTGEKFEIRAKGVMFCGGPFTDELRRLEHNFDEPFTPAVLGSSGIHIILPSYFAPPSFGFVDMNTSDGRFLFFLPWEGHVVVGTTDHKCDPLNKRPEPLESEILWLLHEASKYLSPELQLKRNHVLSAWSGIRPLAFDPHQANDSTASASRDHIVSYNRESGVVFVAGGKWTTYREMAQDGVDKLIEESGIKPETGDGKCHTLDIDLVGKEGCSPNLPVVLMDEFSDSINHTTATHLVRAFGGRARDVLLTKNKNGDKMHRLLISGFPYIEAEVIYSVRSEMAVRAEDIIARRTRLAFLNREAALKAIPRIVELMGTELGWSSTRCADETHRCVSFMKSFGGPLPSRNENTPRIATTADVRLAFENLNDGKTSPGYLHIRFIELIGEILNYSLNKEEIEDCKKFCTDYKYPQYIHVEKFYEWWNSPRLNPHLQLFKESHSAIASKVEGSGTMFG